MRGTGSVYPRQRSIILPVTSISQHRGASSHRQRSLSLYRKTYCRKPQLVKIQEVAMQCPSPVGTIATQSIYLRLTQHLRRVRNSVLTSGLCTYMYTHRCIYTDKYKHIHTTAFINTPLIRQASLVDI